ncbi:MAG: hypothetical protein AB2L24_20675 [Mangrovibacterium sp.]
MRQKDDYLWKGVLEDVLDDFLRYIHPDADQVFDLSKGVTFLDKELEQLFPPEGDNYSIKVVDKLAKVYTRKGNEEWVLLHLEVQNVYRKDFARRMFTYYARIFDKYHKRISAYAIFTGASPKDGANTFEEEFMGTSIRYRFNTFRIMDQDESDLLRSNNPFALVALIAKAAFDGKHVKVVEVREQILLDLKINLLRKMLFKEIPKNKIRGLMNFLTYYIRFEKQETSRIFEQEKQKLAGGSNTMGIEELLLDRAKKQGMEKKSRKIVLNLLTHTDFSDEQIAKLTEVSKEYVQKLRRSLK